MVRATHIELQLYGGNLTDDIDMSVYFYDLPTSVGRRNRHIYPGSGAGGLKVVNLVEVFSRVTTQPVSSDFIYPGQHSSSLKSANR
jgi:UDP-glucose:glycoprotein glucosyltransferase